MSLRRLLSAAVSANLRRSLSTATSSHPPWAIIDYTSRVDQSSSAPTPCFRPLEPPAVSTISAPAHLLNPRERPAAGSNVVQLLGGEVRAASGDGHLLLNYRDLRAEAPCTSWDLCMDMEIQHFVCNPLSGQMLRLPDIGDSRRTLLDNHMGILTQAGGGRRHRHGPPERFAVAELVSRGGTLLRFLSDEGKWNTVVMGIRRKSMPPRNMSLNQETVAFGGRLWWVDLTLGVISLDPFRDTPEIFCTLLPSRSVLPARAPTETGDFSKDEQETARYMREVAKYRRVGVSEGRLRYAELTPGGPFLLSSFALDDEGRAWTLEQQVELRKVLADGGYPVRHNSAPPQIAVLDPLNACAVHLKVGDHVVVVDIHKGKVIGASRLQDDYSSLVPCVLPPWLGASRIPTTGKKDDMEAPDDLVICL